MKNITNKLTENIDKQYLDVELYPATVKDQDVYFTDERVRIPDLVNRGIYKYEVREYCGGPCEIAEHILVDFYGTILSTTPIELEETTFEYKNLSFKYKPIEEEDLDINYNSHITVLDLILDVYRKDLHQSAKSSRE